MSGKKNNEENVDEKILKYIFNSKYYPDYEVSPYYEASPVMDLIAKSRTYDSARNIILENASKNPEIIDELRKIARFYADNYKKEDELWDPETRFVGNLKERRKSTNADGMSLNDVNDKSEYIASILGYDGGLSEMLRNMPEYADNPNKSSYERTKEFVAKELARKFANEEGDGTNEFLRAMLMNRLGFSSNADDEYIAEKLADYIDRTRKYTESAVHEVEHPYSHFGVGFLGPNIQKKQDQGLTPNVADEIDDAAQLVIGGLATKSALGARAAAKAAGTLEHTAPFLKSALVVSGLSGPTNMAHDALDSLLTKHVYSEDEDGEEISERGNVLKVLANAPEYAKRSLLNMALTIPTAGATTMNSVAGKTRGYVRNGINKILDTVFGIKGKKEQLQDIVAKEATQRRAIEEASENALSVLANDAKNTNVMYRDRVKELKTAQKELEDARAVVAKKKSKYEKVTSEDKKRVRDAQEAVRLSEEDVKQANVNIDLNNAERNIANIDKEDALRKLMEETRIAKEPLEKVIDQRENWMMAAPYFAIMKNMINAEDDYQFNTKTPARFMPK